MFDGLETNKFTVVVEVEGHIVVAITGLDMVGRVAVVVVMTLALGAEIDIIALGGKRGLSVLLSLYCLLPA